MAFVLVTFLGLPSIQYLFGFYQDRVKGIAKLGWSTIYAQNTRKPPEATLVDLLVLTCGITHSALRVSRAARGCGVAVFSVHRGREGRQSRCG
jgi:hypothetical protein